MFGPRIRVLRERLLALADRARDAALAIAVLERTLASDATEPAAGLLIDLFLRRLNAGDFEGASHELARAAEHGADPEQVLSHLADLETGVREAEGSPSGDALLSIATARAIARAAVLEKSARACCPREWIGRGW